MTSPAAAQVDRDETAVKLAQDQALSARGPGDDAANYEATHVHSVYEAIAPHFSATRHKPWPAVASFLDARAPGSVGLDVGCGNGKYLHVNPRVHLVGSDRSGALLRLARAESHPESTAEACVIADGLALPHRKGAVDFAICIAVIHHLSTRERRREAIAALLECVRGDGVGKVLVYVWALEQSSSRRGWDVNSEQDTLVPWVMKKRKEDGVKQPDETYQRYYHLYREGELEEDVSAVGGTLVESGYERDNWWVVCSKQGG